VSWGGGCARKGAPGVYTRISAFEGWLHAKTQISQDQPSSETQQTVENTLLPNNPAGLSVAYVQGNKVAIGQKVTVRATTERPGYLLLVDVTPDGKLNQIYPSEASLRSRTGNLINANKIEPDRPLILPNLAANPYEGFEFEIDGPIGEGRLIGVLSEETMKWLKIPQGPRSFESRADALGYLAALGRILNRDLIVEGKPEPNISIVITPYSVVQ
jgi:hypothetical protein